MARVLIVDDDELIGEMLSVMVEDMGHSASSATTLKAGFEKASSDNFDVIFLDIRMPDGNGLPATWCHAQASATRPCAELSG